MRFGFSLMKGVTQRSKEAKIKVGCLKMMNISRRECREAESCKLKRSQM